MKFKKFIEDNEEEFKTFLTWENYDLNETTIAVTEKIKEHALMVLRLRYGQFEVEEDEIKDSFIGDLFTYFPILLQQLSVSRLIDSLGVKQTDINTETLARTERVASETTQESELTVGTTVEETTDLDTETATTGTVTVAGTSSIETESTVSIENSSEVEMTGNRSVSLAHDLPEQSISGTTHNFTTDEEGTPILSTSTVQSATESFNTSNPIDTTETSTQATTGEQDSSSTQTTTNNVKVADTGSNTRTTVNTGSDVSDSTTNVEGTNTVEETRTIESTNKQFAYEIAAFLNATDSVIAFKNWRDRFGWVVGII